ncbi:MAG: hypothetical protein V1944_00415 [Candidatus Aenigmatarchaeota archaeon]
MPTPMTALQIARTYNLGTPVQEARAFIQGNDFSSKRDSSVNVGNVDQVVTHLLGAFPLYGRRELEQVTYSVLRDMNYTGEVSNHFDEQVAGQPLFTIRS